jgi:hypothetical protein
MPWCPDCRTEYDPGIEFCSDCGAALVATLPPQDEGEEPVVVLDADSAIEAQVAKATLEAEGIPAFVQTPTLAIPGDNLVDDDNPEREVLVPAELADEAADILHTPPLSEEELTALEEAGRVGNATADEEDTEEP